MAHISLPDGLPGITGPMNIHDTVLIAAAAFCMFNRYVDGLATWAPAEPEAYKESGVRLATQGYMSDML